MAHHLTDQEIESIVKVIDNWPDSRKLTYENLRGHLTETLGLMSTRQTLQKFRRIKDAMKARKNKSSDIEPLVIPASLSIAAKKINRIELENERLNRENNNLLSQFMVWQYNASKHGVNMHMLNMSLPIKRG
jgi:hypothetical protein